MVSDVLNTPTVVLGDLVGSRRARDRVALHERLVAALDTANATYRPVEPLAPSVGDECQGVFHNVADAVRATLLVRASMRTDHDVRFGLGVGAVQRLAVRADGGFQQDGPGWWAARDAIEYVAGADAGRTVPHSLATALFIATERDERRASAKHFALPPALSEHPDARAINAFLVARDHVVSRMNDRDRRILRALLLGLSVTAIAEQEGVSTSAISQRSRRSGAAALVYAHEAAL